MQFQHPELLWGLFLLLIPIFIHLFQLRRYKKTPFTNVKFLKKVVSESRKSRSLKKWLLLFTRLMLIAAAICAFAKPFLANKSATAKKETVIYLDDSFSMQAKTENGTLLSDAVQELAEVLPADQTFSLFTNSKLYKNIVLKDVQNELLRLPHGSKQLALNDIYLKAKTLFETEVNSIKDLIVVSDFQQNMLNSANDTLLGVNTNLVSKRKEGIQNIAIDSVYVSSASNENIELTAIISTNSTIENTAVSLFNGDKLIAKSSANFQANTKSEVLFTVSANEPIKGRIAISDSGLPYDNQLFFNIDAAEKIKVLSIENSSSNFLKKIFTPDEFDFSAYPLKNLNYSRLSDKNFIILNELDQIPQALASSLTSFKNKGGSILVIPSNTIELQSYNALLSSFMPTKFDQPVKKEKNITRISYDHPLFQNVFDKQVSNFQYPKVNQYYQVKTNSAKILNYQDGMPFLLGGSNVYAFTASLAETNSNFKYSPLIVPTLYNMGLKSLKLPKLYQLLKSNASVDISMKLSKDTILKMEKEGEEFIPRQQSFANKVTLNFDDNPTTDGIYSLINNTKQTHNISFNYSKNESELTYADMSQLQAFSKNNSLKKLFKQFQSNYNVNELWKWFVTLALLFMIIEVLIQKFLK